MQPGKVYLIGAGPGDPELLTLKAVRVLQSADVWLMDALVPPEIRRYAAPHALLLEVGKRCGQTSITQAEINDCLCDFAQSGRVVARVKGGDPLLFGRAGEELQALAEAGIPVEVINGVTAGLAVPALLGIPLTLRGTSSGVIFVTGHPAVGDGPDWRHLAASGLTLVVYMGLARLAHICAALIAAGLPGQTPVAVMEQATRPGQQQVISTLADLPTQPALARMRGPALAVIGAVVAYAQASPWPAARGTPPECFSGSG
jgi:uroporphyrin-III C-methyltransferase